MELEQAPAWAVSKANTYFLLDNTTSTPWNDHRFYASNFSTCTSCDSITLSVKLPHPVLTDHCNTSVMFHLASVNSMFEIRFTRRHGYYNYTGVLAAAVIARRASRIGCWNVGRIGGIKQCKSVVVLGDLPSMVRRPIYTPIQTLIEWILSKKTLGFSIDHVLYIDILCVYYAISISL